LRQINSSRLKPPRASIDPKGVGFVAPCEHADAPDALALLRPRFNGGAAAYGAGVRHCAAIGAAIAQGVQQSSVATSGELAKKKAPDEPGPSSKEETTAKYYPNARSRW
jgi:hypothetical protein